MYIRPATFVHNPLLRALARWGLRLSGWSVEGRLPQHPSYVLIGAPHTSNWDFLLMLAMALVFQVEFVWMGKHTLFKRPFDKVFHWMGGIPINRTKAHGVVSRAVEVFGAHERLIMVIAPEG
ncbi:MAG: glycerol acyltransferase, partial [Pseudomonadota bacterium]|nr:glycerol acyltransferase [Pseudomonadota bacterium]